MNLYIDAGNSRLKWRISDGGASLARGVVPSALAAVELNGALGVYVGQITKVLIASVLSPERNSQLLKCLSALGLPSPLFARSAPKCAGVINGYDAPERLGVDRWLGLLAVYSRFKATSILVSLGTATTIDLLLADGRHLGGYIAPGLQMFVGALGQQTCGVGDIMPELQRLGPGTDTQRAVSGAYLAMLQGLVAAAETGLGECSERPLLIATGGDAEVLLHLYPDAICYQEAVLDGLDCLDE